VTGSFLAAIPCLGWLALGIYMGRTEEEAWRASVLLPGIVLPFIFALPGVGYAMRVIRGTASGNDRLPEWTDWGALIADGGRWLGTVLGWGFLIFLPIGCPFFATIALLDDPVWAWAVTPMLNLLLLLITPPALARAAVEESWSAGMDVGAVLRTLRNGFRYCALIAVVEIAVSFGGALGLGDELDLSWARDPTRIAFFAVSTLVLAFYLHCVTSHLYGQVFRLAQTTARTAQPA